MNEQTCALRPARNAFSRIGFALSAISVIATAAALLWVWIPARLIGEDNWFTGTSWGVWLGSFLPMYLIAIPVALLIMRKLPGQKPQSHPMGFENAFVIFTVSLFITYAGNFLGTILSGLLSGGMAENAVLDYVEDDNPLKYLFVVVLAPVLEEYVCRKQIIDRTRQYGEKTAVFLSGLTFGLLHQNLFQFFYAFGMGLVFGYVYIRTGRLRYTIGFHALLNFMGGVIAPWLLSLSGMGNVDPNASQEAAAAAMMASLPGLVVTMVYVFFLLGMSVTGLVFLIIKCRKLIWYPSPLQLPRGTAAKTVYWNVGMVVYVLLCAAAMVEALL